MACLVCRSARLAPLYSGVRDHYGVASGTFAFLRCDDCGSATLDPLPTAERLAALYAPEYTFKPRGSWLAALEWRLFYRRGYAARLRIIRALTGVGAGRVLEVGCGSGLFLRFLRDAGYTVEGIETSKTDADYARERFGLEVRTGSLETVTLPADAFDLALLVYVMEHMPDPHGALAWIRRALKPGGRVVLGLPVIDSGQARLLGARWSAVTEAPRHVLLPSFDGAVRLLSAAGFHDIVAVPSPALENAGHVALSWLPAAATPLTGPRPAPGALLRRLAGGLLLAPALVVALAERWPRGRAGTMFFCGRK
ncbi:MAG: class I SAM-dependent methyltransferase [Candidatus Rokuibacteriota bacterium]